jgi:glutamyl-Q tRNA(Asp) synthetase
MTITRFAPSPTGHLHLGHALAAWVAREEADRQGGLMLLRHEDLDRERCREEYYERIEEDLCWLGIHWMGQAWRQGERHDTYREAMQRLIELEVLYPCFCTRREIALELSAMGQAPQQDDGVNPAVYPGTCRNLTEKSRREKIRAGEAHAWRLDSSRATALTGALTFFDHRAGTIAVDSQLLGDVIAELVTAHANGGECFALFGFSTRLGQSEHVLVFFIESRRLLQTHHRGQVGGSGAAGVLVQSAPALVAAAVEEK